MRFQFFSLLVFAPLVACQSASSGGACPYAFGDGGLASYESAGNGGVQGPGLAASFCNVGVTLQSGNNGTASTVALTLDSSTAATLSTVSTPATAVEGTLTGSVQIAAFAPGVYKSTDPTGCGSLSFSYAVPLTSSSVCEGADAQAGCPTECTFTYSCAEPSGNGCCVPLGTTYVYGTSTNTCSAVAIPAVGSWSVTLTSVVPTDAGAGTSPTYVGHGSLAATLEGTTGVTGTANLSLTF
jgi:hypothetical protein